MRLVGRMLALCVLLSFAACEGGSAEPARPNVLLVVVDTLRADHLGSYGYPLATSPSVDALAASGVLFERAIAGASSTGPSHASIFSSRFTRGHTVGMANGSTRLEGVTTLAEMFAGAGYDTAAFVGNAMLNRRLGFDRGFAVYDDELPSREGSRNVFERRAGDTTARALAWLESQADEPFFLWVHYQDPHGPYTPPEAYEGSLPVAPRPGERPLVVTAAGKGGLPKYQALPGVTLPSAYESRYGEEILYADRAIGELVAAVDARSGPAGAIVLLTADHGEAMGEGGHYFAHGLATTPDQSHVPLILRAPGIEPGRRRDVVHHVDIFPTLVELAGIEAPQALTGLALGPYLRRADELPERLVYCDDGSELAAYSGEEFVRMTRKRGRASYQGYRWSRDGRWSAVPEAHEAWRPAIDRYLAQETAARAAPPPSPELAEQLRALGYGVDE
jgi:arylsulfatase A-like enzyme